MALNEIFFEFSNKDRFDLFKCLYNEKKRHSELEKELKIPGPEISRHLSRLLKKKLINKTGDKLYEMTEIGRIFYRVMNILKTSLKYEEFFNSHEVNSIPLNFILQLGTLKSIKVNDKTMHNIDMWSKIIKESDKFIFAITDEFQDSLLPIVEKKLNYQSIEIRAIIAKNVLNSSSYESFKDRHKFYEKMDIFQNIRVLDDINVSLIVSDKGAIIFLGKEGKIDYSECINGSDITFLNWSKDLFKWYWKIGASLDNFIKKKFYNIG